MRKIWLFSVATSLITPAFASTTLDGLRVNPVKYPEKIALKYSEEKINLRKKGDLDKLLAFVDRSVALSLKQEEDKKAAKARGEKYAEPEGYISPKMRSGFDEIKALIRVVRESKNPHDQNDALIHISEIVDSVRLNTKYPVPLKMDLAMVPAEAIDRFNTPIGKGTQQATNLAQASDDKWGASDPVESTFWKRPKSIGGQDLYHFFGEPLSLGDEICKYDEPKTSYGTNPGFEMKCPGKRTIKVKFGNVYHSGKDSEVAITRFFGALGFNVEPNDYSKVIRVKYDRRIIDEFNSRKDISTKITAFWFIPIHRVKIQKFEDPYSYIEYAVTKSGERIPSDVLKANLAALEPSLDYLVMHEANIQLKDQIGKNLGAWDWNALNHPERRELRGAALLSAWLNFYDARWDNTRLKLVDMGGREELRHYISDLGGGLGNSENLLKYRGGLVNEFPWTFTDISTGKVKFTKYTPIDNNEAFKRMTMDDARWMARNIAELTENQYKQALIASGYSSAEIKLYVEKLANRRDRMIRDLGLWKVIPRMREKPVARDFNYDPKVDGQMTAVAADGALLYPNEHADLVVRAGKAVPR